MGEQHSVIEKEWPVFIFIAINKIFKIIQYNIRSKISCVTCCRSIIIVVVAAIGVYFSVFEDSMEHVFLVTQTFWIIKV